MARFCALLALCAGALAAQPASRPTFEVASVKAQPNCTPSGRGGPSAGRLELPCVTARTLIRAAYGGFSGGQLSARFLDVVGGPAWLDTDRFEINAKADGNVSAAVLMGPMLQTLLEDRFQLKSHIEPREKAVYLLTLAKDAAKLTPSKEGSCVPIDLNNIRNDPESASKYCGAPSVKVADGRFSAEFRGITLEELAGRFLSGLAGRPVVDKTGLNGRYDLKLQYVPETPSGVRLNGEPAPPSMFDSSAPSIFVALQQQLGLKLTSDKAPIDVIVVDSAQKPTEN